MLEEKNTHNSIKKNLYELSDQLMKEKQKAQSLIDICDKLEKAFNQPKKDYEHK